MLVLGGLAFFAGYRYVSTPYDGETVRVNIPSVSNHEQMREILRARLGSNFGDKVFRILNVRKMPQVRGSYEIKKGETALSVAKRLRGRIQTPVNVVIPNLRDVDRAVEVIASNFEFDSQALTDAIDSIMGVRGMKREALPSIFMPDTYQYYWTATPLYVAESLFKQYDNFWDSTRLSKASQLHLSPLQVSALASIVEEESAKVDERPIIARLYLNRLDRGMKLQADPTVKYAVGDPSLKRILNTHLSTESPYNTYLHEGLPPGPIRMVDKRTLDAVLNAPSHKYLYMCAREDFSGYHNFATTLADHNANARKYHQALNKNNIR